MNTPPPPPPASPDNRRINMVKLGLGCVGLSTFVCTGAIMLVLILTPIAFRSLSPEYQDKFLRRIPALAAFKATVPFTYLPTIGATNANALALLATPTSGNSTPVPTGSRSNGGLSAGGNDANVPLPTSALSTSTPITPVAASSTPLPITNTPVLATDNAIAATNTPVLNVAALSPTPPPDNPPATALPPATVIPAPISFHNSSFEWVPQGWNNCGPANLTQALKYYGWQGKQDEIANYLKPNREDKNVSPWQMVEYVNSQTNVKALWRVAGDLNLVKRLVADKFAVIMETGYDVAGEGWMGHYLTVIGYDDNQGLLYGLDTWLGDGKDHQGFHEEYNNLDSRWQSFNRAYIVVYTSDREAELASILGPDADLQYNYTRAVSVARTEASAQPNNPYAWFNLGSSFTLLQKYKEASIAFDQAVNSTTGLPFRMLWYQFTPYEAYYNTGNYTQVLALAQTALATTPYVEETFYWQGMAYAAQGQTGKATDDFKKVLKFNPNFLPASDMLAQLESGKFAPPVVAQAGQ
ncbi:MAG: C39 family peptidase [Chloroflexota bacterium]